MNLLFLRIRAAWLLSRAAHAGDILNFREADYLEAKAIYFARMEALRKVRSELATRELPEVVLRDIVRP